MIYAGQPEDNLILVDGNDNEIGSMGKTAVHEQGLLHRAFSVYVFNSRGELLLQQRAEGKYHSAGLWTNTCCSHPRKGEEVEVAAHRRLREELGMDCVLRKAYDFIYRAEFDNGLTEHEFDHVFVGTTDDLPQPDPDEVKSCRYLATDKMEEEMEQHPERFTEWHKIAWPGLKAHLF